MGLFDDVLSSVSGSILKSFQTGGAPGVLSEILGKTDLGGVGGLLNQLQQGGLGHLVNSWLGSGSNLPISPDQLRAALGSGRLQQMAAAAGIPIDKLLATLSQHLPGTIDSMSPNGTLQEPDAGGPLEDQAGLKDIR
jgi:uncharacterized protein YidB (DUF937 family)